MNTQAKLFDGTEVTGLDGLRSYLATTRREHFVRYFCRKLLGYSLGRAVQLTDEPLLDDMTAALKANGYRFGVAVEAIVRSPQFRQVRVADAEEPAGEVEQVTTQPIAARHFRPLPARQAGESLVSEDSNRNIRIRPLPACQAGE